MEDLFTRYVNDVIAVLAFGIKCDSMKNPSNEFYEMGKEIYDLSNFYRFRQVKSLGYAFFPTLMKVRFKIYFHWIKGLLNLVLTLLISLK